MTSAVFRFRSWAPIVLIAAVAWVPAARAGGTDGAAVPAGRSARSDAGLLEAIEAAARNEDFVGTVVVQRGDEVDASRVVHVFDGKRSHERVLTLDGQPREFIRTGDTVRCLYPRWRRVVVRHEDLRDFPAFAHPGAKSILRHYTLRRVGADRVAGIACDVVELVPRDRLRYGYRLCVDPATGLLFKAQTLNTSGAVLEQIAFTDVHVGGPIDPALLNPSWPTAGWTVEQAHARATALRQEGWHVTAPSGFHRLAEVVRRLIGAGPAGSRSALQAVYSDGLATISVFIEPGAPVSGTLPAEQRGPVAAVSRQVDDARVTVVGDVPPATAESVAESVVHQSVPH
ncbi:sigma-E factor regulatory protein [Burkholderiales bacterium GJ-E10]|nr:sigma-E factor regulatory protein [Burkholderiales bacterium GJ-E10]